MLLGLTALLPKLVQWAAHALRPLMDWAGGSEGALAVDAMILSPRRSSATVGALMVGLMFVFSTGAYIQSHRRMIDRWMSQMINADIFVATSTMLRSTTYHFSEATGQEIAGLPEVKRLENVRFTSIPFRGDSAALIAIEMDGFLVRANDAVDGFNRRILLDLLPKGKGALASRNFSVRWGIRVGDQLKLDTPTGLLELPVLGVVDDYRSEKGTIFLDRALYKKYWRDDAIDFFDISLNPGVDRAAAKRDIERLTSGTVHAFVYTNAEFKKWVSGLVDQFFLLNYMQLVVAVLVFMLGIINTLIISVSERGREIGIVRAIGGLRSQIRKMMLLEALAIAIIGVSIGALAGVLSAQFMAHTVSLALAGYVVPFYFPWALILLSLPVVAAGSVLAGWWPAQHAARGQVIEAIGYE
jgi:putative ABC transport system permease protein